MFYDCFPFFNELDLLEIRLNTLDSIVDKFVLVEAMWTHAGNPKPLYFDEAKDEPRFAKFRDKIIHVIVDDKVDDHGNSWVLENYQRNCISRALIQCQREDIIMISDADEIPFPEKVLELKDLPGIKSIIPLYFGYYLNLFRYGYRLKLGCNILSYKDYLNILDEDYVEGSYFQTLPGEGTNATKIRVYFGPKKNLYNWCGWHFSYMGGAERVLQKLQNFAHQEHNVNLTKESIEKNIRNATLLGEKLMPVQLDQTYPQYVIDNLERFRPFLYPTTQNTITAQKMIDRHQRLFDRKRYIKKTIWQMLRFLAGLIPSSSIKHRFLKLLELKSVIWEIRDCD